MTSWLEESYNRIAQLPETEQDTIAALIFDELEEDAQWNRKFAASGDVLSRLAQIALTEYQAGKTLPFDPDTL